MATAGWLVSKRRRRGWAPQGRRAEAQLAEAREAALSGNPKEARKSPPMAPEVRGRRASVLNPGPADADIRRIIGPFRPRIAELHAPLDREAGVHGRGKSGNADFHEPRSDGPGLSTVPWIGLGLWSPMPARPMVAARELEPYAGRAGPRRPGCGAEARRSPDEARLACGEGQRKRQIPPPGRAGGGAKPFRSARERAKPPKAARSEGRASVRWRPRLSGHGSCPFRERACILRPTVSGGLVVPGRAEDFYLSLRRKDRRCGTQAVSPPDSRSRRASPGRRRRGPPWRRRLRNRGGPRRCVSLRITAPRIRVGSGWGRKGRDVRSAPLVERLFGGRHRLEDEDPFVNYTGGPLGTGPAPRARGRGPFNDFATLT